MTRTTLTEAATVKAGRAGNMLIQLITPGVGSSGVYTDTVLEAAANTRVFPAGTLMFADHPTATESHDRPERSIRDVAGVLVEDARWDGGALVAEARAYAPWRTILTEMKDDIGVSIRAGQARHEAIGTRISDGPSWASDEPSRYSTSEWITLCGWTTILSASSGIGNR